MRWVDPLALKLMHELHEDRIESKQNIQLSIIRSVIKSVSGFETEYTRSGEFTTVTFFAKKIKFKGSTFVRVSKTDLERSRNFDSVDITILKT